MFARCWAICRSCYKQALGVDKSFRQANKNLAALLFKTGHYERAKDILIRLFDEDPEDESQHF